MTATPIRLAVLGAGNFVRDVHLPSLAALGAEFQIVAVYSRTQASAQKVVDGLPGSVDLYTDIAPLLARPDIELVDIVLPIGPMSQAVAQALQAGKHVISEKPIAPDVATARSLIETYAQSQSHFPGQQWMVGENWRYEDAFLQARDLLANGAIGQPLLCNWMIHQPIWPDSKYHRTTWRRDNSFPGGFLLDTGVHHMAVLRLILGEIVQVSGVTRSVRPDLPPADSLAATLLFANGVIGNYTVSYAAASALPPYLHITGAEGELRLHRDELLLLRQGQTESLPVVGKNGTQKELAALALAIREGIPHVNPPQAALQDLAVMGAIFTAAETGHRTLVEVH